MQSYWIAWILHWLKQQRFKGCFDQAGTRATIEPLYTSIIYIHYIYRWFPSIPTKTMVDSLQCLCQTSASSIQHPLGKSFLKFSTDESKNTKNGGHRVLAWFVVMITLAEALDLSDSLWDRVLVLFWNKNRFFCLTKKQRTGSKMGIGCKLAEIISEICLFEKDRPFSTYNDHHWVHNLT